LRAFILAAAAAAIMTTSAPAAYLSGAKGTVLVNDQPVPANAEVAAGDRVKPLSAPVNIVYNDKTFVTVPPGQTTIVLGNNVVNYTVAPAGSSGPGSPEAILFAGGICASIGLVAGAVVGGAVALLTNSLSKQPKPANP
jgi:hypothetical protein